MPTRRPRWDKPALIVLVLGLMLTATTGFMTWRETAEQEKLDLAEQGTLIKSLLSETVELGITQVRSIQAFFEASEEVTAVEFSRFALYQGTSPGMIAIGFAPVVPRDEFAAFALAARQQRSWYVIVGADRRPIGPLLEERPVVPVWYAYQHRLGPSLLTLDLADDPIRLDAIRRALRSGRPAVTAKIGLLEDPEPRYVEIYSAVRSHSGGRPGVVFATIDLHSLVEPGGSITLRGISLGVDLAERGLGTVSEVNRWRGESEVGDRVLVVELTRNVRASSLYLVAAIAVGVLVSFLAANVTQLRLTSRRREQEITRLIQVTREKDVFLASVAHELRTPLTSVVGATALLAKEWRSLDPEEVDELLGASAAEATDLGDLIEDLLVAGRLEAGAIHFRTETIDLDGEVERVAARVGEIVSLRHEKSDPPRWVEADPLRVRQIVRNLLVNAARHANTSVVVTSEGDDDRARLIVSNDGPPVAPEIVDVLFNPYQDGIDRPRTPGSIGLGMPVSQRLARAMGGEITYHYDGGWSHFAVHLPAAEPPAQDHAEPVAEVSR